MGQKFGPVKEPAEQVAAAPVIDHQLRHQRNIEKRLQVSGGRQPITSGAGLRGRRASAPSFGT